MLSERLLFHVPHDVVVSMSTTKEIIFELWLHIISHTDSVLYFLLPFIGSCNSESLKSLLRGRKITLALFLCWAGALNIRNQILEDYEGL